MSDYIKNDNLHILVLFLIIFTSLGGHYHVLLLNTNCAFCNIIKPTGKPSFCNIIKPTGKPFSVT